MSFDSLSLHHELEAAADALHGLGLFQATDVFMQEGGQYDVHGMPLAELMELLCGSKDLDDQVAWSDCAQPRAAVILCLSAYGCWVDYQGTIQREGA